MPAELRSGKEAAGKREAKGLFWLSHKWGHVVLKATNIKTAEVTAVECKDDEDYKKQFQAQQS